jgi:EARP and GARP complex-interacting protein 1
VQLHIIEYLESSSEILPVTSMEAPFEGECAIASLEACPREKGVIAAVEDVLIGVSAEDDESSDRPTSVLLLRVPVAAAGGLDATEEPVPEVLCRLSVGAKFSEVPKGATGCIRMARWLHDDDEDDEDEEEDDAAASRRDHVLVTVAHAWVGMWQVSSEGGTFSASLRAVWMAPGSAPAVSATVDVTNTSHVTIAAGGDLYMWDSSSSKGKAATAPLVANAHAGLRVLDVSSNPNKPWHVASSGEDGCIRIWNLRAGRKAAELPVGAIAPLLVLKGHTHWATGVRYNPFHDQLLASCGTDGAVCLWRASTVSSAPVMEDAEGGASASSKHASKVAPDGAPRRWAAHTESIHGTGLTWGASSAWNIATLSADGRITVQEVPADEKYRVLL